MIYQLPWNYCNFKWLWSQFSASLALQSQFTHNWCIFQIFFYILKLTDQSHESLIPKSLTGKYIDTRCCNNTYPQMRHKCFLAVNDDAADWNDYCLRSPKRSSWASAFVTSLLIACTSIIFNDDEDNAMRGSTVILRRAAARFLVPSP